MRSCVGFLWVYSITSRVSFEEDVPRIRQGILQVYDTDDVPMVLVGNKCDDELNRRVSAAEGAQMAASSLGGCAFLETSAKKRVNVDECFDVLVRAIRRHQRGANGQGQERPSTRRCILY
jgi:GTPase SAR1 family protein